MGKIYAVKSGRNIGIFKSWSECEEQVKGYSGAQYKSFTKLDDAEKYLNGDNLKSESNGINMDGLKIYVDGSYSKNNLACGYGCVMVEGDKVIHTISSKVDVIENDNLWNVSGEIEGALAAISWTIDNGYKAVTLFYDYVGIKNWADGSWRAKKNTTKKYVEMIQKYQKEIDIRFVKVKAHSGDKFNDLADELAKQATESQFQPSNPYVSDETNAEEIKLTLDKFNTIVGDFSKESCLIKYKGYTFNENILKKIGKHYWKSMGNKVKDLVVMKVDFDLENLNIHFEYVGEENESKIMVNLEGEYIV